MKLKTIKFIAPLACLSTAVSMVPIVTSCSNASYNVTINNSNRFTVDGGKIGANKATNGKLYQITIRPVSNFKIEHDDIEVKIGGKVETNWVYQENILSITGQFITGNIELNITPSVINLFEIDETCNQIKGFATGLTTQEIERECKGTLTIPMSVMSIADSAFFDGEKSTIPSSITNLVFEENLIPVKNTEGKWEMNTFSHLSTYGENPGIGKYAFKESPFKNIKLPVGQGYGIGEYAFENSKVEVLEFPNPPCAETDEEAEAFNLGCKGNWKLRSYINDFTDKKYFFDSHKIILRDCAFYNTSKLNYISFTPFVHFADSNCKKCFKLEGDVVSNATILDFSNYTWAHYIDDKNDFQNRYAQQVVDNVKALVDLGSIFTSDLESLQDQFNVMPSESPTVDKRVYLLYWNYYSLMGNDAEQRKYNQQLQLLLSNDSSIVSTDVWGESGKNLVTIDSLQNLCHKAKSYQSPIDGFCLPSDKESIELKVSSKPDERVQEFALSGLVSAFGYKGDLEITITKAEWEVGNQILLELQHISRDQIEDPTEKANYKDNWFTVLWDTAPKAGDKVKLTFDVNSPMTQRLTTGLELTITFTE